MKVLKVMNRLTTVILAIILLITTSLAILSYVSGGNPKLFGSRMMVVLSGSMEPEIKAGSVIFIKDVDNVADLTRGDIITFYSPVKKDMLMTHRIIDINGEGELKEYLTKGDNNKAADPLAIQSGSIIGEYANVEIPYLGYIISFVQSPKGIGLLLIIPGIVLIVYNVIIIWKAISNWEKEGKNSMVSH